MPDSQYTTHHRLANKNEGHECDPVPLDTIRHRQRLHCVTMPVADCSDPLLTVTPLPVCSAGVAGPELAPVAILQGHRRLVDRTQRRNQRLGLFDCIRTLA